jgi:hypothetical protein
MRLPKSLSYSSFSTLEKNPEEFYCKYLADNRPEREPQTPPMCAGSAFDAYVKSALHRALFGSGLDPKYEFSALFESQVEKHNWDFALRAGKHLFQAYRDCGAYGDLLVLLNQAVEPPKFEFSVFGTVGGAPFMGKPDCRFVLDYGHGRIHNIYDWKCRGYCGKYNTSPTPGYAICRDCFPGEKLSKSHGKEHGKYLGQDFRGLTINAGYMETCSQDFAAQLCLYAWMLGETPGDENVVLGIEELCAKFMGEGVRPNLRYARHRARAKTEFQLKLVDRVKNAWERITSGHFFPEMPLDQSKARCELLEDVAKANNTACDETEEWFKDVTKSNFYRS